MKAIRVLEHGGPEVMHVQEVPTPKPDTGQILIAVSAAGVNPVDTYIRAGTFYPIALPYTPGMDGAGVVEAVGPGVKKVSKGDRVYTAGTVSGSYAQKTLCEESQVWPLPANVTFEQGAAIYVPYATAYRALFQKARALPGEIVLVHGASGGVGTAAIQLARAAGLTVIGTAGTDAGRALIQREGAHYVLNHNEVGYLDKIAGLVGDRPNVVLEMLANVNLMKDLNTIAHGGRIVVIGNRGSIDFDARAAMAAEASIFGMVLMSMSSADAEQIHHALYAGLENGTLRPVVGKKFALADAPKAHEEVVQPGAYGKIVILP